MWFITLLLCEHVIRSHVYMSRRRSVTQNWPMSTYTSQETKESKLTIQSLILQRGCEIKRELVAPHKVHSLVTLEACAAFKWDVDSSRSCTDESKSLLGNILSVSYFGKFIWGKFWMSTWVWLIEKWLENAWLIDCNLRIIPCATYLS